MTKEEIKEKIDDYEQTVCAILGFMNLYRFDDKTKTFKVDVKLFQGRKLKIDGKEQEVTPDLGILEKNKTGVIGEVKKTLPQDQEYWLNKFEQLKKYDNELIGWDTDDKKVNNHDIVLLTHIKISRKVKDYYEKNIINTENEIKKSFSIIEFYRTEENNSYFSFRKEYGKLSNIKIDSELYSGISIPMKVYIDNYSCNKLYDDFPPLAYLMSLIWENIIQLKASDDYDNKFSRLRKRQKLDIDISIDDIIDKLHKGFSFYNLQNNEENQPIIPKRNWIIKACDKFVDIKEATWKDSNKKELIFKYQKYDNILEHFIEKCIDENPNNEQENLFPEIIN